MLVSYYSRQHRGLRMSEHVKELFDFGAAMLAFCAFAVAGVGAHLPQIASGLTIIWYIWRFIEAWSFHRRRR